MGIGREVRLIFKETAMVRRVMTQFTAGEVRRLRAEVDDWGDPKWTGTEIAVALGVSESTVWRVLNKQAAYEKMGKVDKGGLSMEMAAAALAISPSTGMDEAARASEEKMKAWLEKGMVKEEAAPTREESWTEKQMSPETKARLALFRDVVPERPREAARARVIPPSPLDGGEGGEDETQGVGMKALGDNLSALSGNNANELLKELSS